MMENRFGEELAERIDEQRPHQLRGGERGHFQRMGGGGQAVVRDSVAEWVNMGFGPPEGWAKSMVANWPLNRIRTGLGRGKVAFPTMQKVPSWNSGGWSCIGNSRPRTAVGQFERAIVK